VSDLHVFLVLVDRVLVFIMSSLGSKTFASAGKSSTLLLYIWVTLSSAVAAFLFVSPMHLVVAGTSRSGVWLWPLAGTELVISRLEVTVPLQKDILLTSFDLFDVHVSLETNLVFPFIARNNFHDGINIHIGNYLNIIFSPNFVDF